MRDFTLTKYRELLNALLQSGKPFSLRHDVDKLPQRSLAMARLEASMGLKAVYYFRCLPCSYNEQVIRKMVSLGHEIGYHYEDMSLTGGDPDLAIRHFREWLAIFRTFYPVHRICMHGAPTSKWDGRELWKYYDYHQEGIDYEPYFDEDYSRSLYLTDTGRAWDGYKVSVRDKVPEQEQYIREGLVFHSTDELIAALLDSHSTLCTSSYQTLCLTTHPQRWTDSLWGWFAEWCGQNGKNIIKRILVKARS